MFIFPFLISILNVLALPFFLCTLFTQKRDKKNSVSYKRSERVTKRPKLAIPSVIEPIPPEPAPILISPPILRDAFAAPSGKGKLSQASPAELQVRCRRSARLIKNGRKRESYHRLKGCGVKVNISSRDKDTLGQILRKRDELSSEATSVCERFGLTWDCVRERLSAKRARGAYDPSFIRMCLLLYCSSKKNYNMWRNLGLIELPSGDTLRKHGAMTALAGEGMCAEKVKVMLSEYRNVTGGAVPDFEAAAAFGGLVMDEIKVQQGLVFQNGSITGLACNLEDPVGELARALEADGTKAVAADYMAQFFWISFGVQFKFPIAAYPVKGSLSKTALLTIVTDILEGLMAVGFVSRFLTWDGHPTHDAISRDCVIPTGYDPHPVLVILNDPDHLVKRLRNHLLSTERVSKKDPTVKVRTITVPGEEGRTAQFKHLRLLFDEDARRLIRVHPKITRDVVYLNSWSKMRNHA